MGGQSTITTFWVGQLLRLRPGFSSARSSYFLNLPTAYKNPNCSGLLFRCYLHAKRFTRHLIIDRAPLRDT